MSTMSKRSRSVVLTALALSLMLLACGSVQSVPTAAIELITSVSTPNQEATSPSSAASNEECSNDYFPTEEGATWRYSSEANGGGAQERTSTIVSTTDDGFSVEHALASGATFVIEWSCSNGDLTQVTPTASLYFSGSSATVTTTNHSGVTLPADLDSTPSWLESGEWSVKGGSTAFEGSYTSDITAVGTEAVSVPFGTFEAMRVEATSEGTVNREKTPPCQITQWWVKDTGLVKQETICPAGGQSMTEVTELVSFQTP
jgi:hypothetical protein